ncbi:MAG: hypothetical protein RIT32_277 [Actinomycetota bacterium]|jgi:branched-subunit amino acid transport protein
MSWAGVLIVGVISYLTKLFGSMVPQRVLQLPYVARLAFFLPTALLAALTSVQVFVSDNQLVIDARFAGIIAGAIAYKLRANFAVIVVTAALVAAILRAAFNLS